MCSPTNQQIIDAVLADFIVQKRAFTAFDVSLEAKARGADERHRHMRGYIHNAEALQNAVDFGEYKKTQIELVGVSQPPFLYHHETYDPADYQPTNDKVLSVTSFNPMAPGAATASVNPVIAAAFDPTVSLGASQVPSITGSATTDHVRHKNDNGTYSLGYGSSLLIELDYVRACGLNPGETVYVYPENNKVILSKANPGNGRAKRIEQRGGIRLSKISLMEAGLKCDTFKVENTKIDDKTVIQVSAP